MVTTGAETRRGATPGLIRRLNEQLLLEQLRERGAVSRSELASSSGLSPPCSRRSESHLLDSHRLWRKLGVRRRRHGWYMSLSVDIGAEFLRPVLEKMWDDARK